MGDQIKDSRQLLKMDKAAVQRLLDAAKILREVTSQEDIERIKRKLGLSNLPIKPSVGVDDRI